MFAQPDGAFVALRNAFATRKASFLVATSPAQRMPGRSAGLSGVLAFDARAAELVLDDEDHADLAATSRRVGEIGDGDREAEAAAADAG
jgi:hypothetical protein